ncbi:MAG TPA: type II secretion system protein [bacterium]
MDVRGRETGRRVILGSGGYSLVEMMIAIGMAVVVGAGLYFVFTAQQRSSRSQKTYNDLQTTCSFALDTIKNDLLLAGYRAKNVTEPISAAGATAVTFEFWDDRASFEPPYDDITQFTNHTQVTYGLTGGNLTKTIRRWHTPGAGAYDTPLTFTLAPNVSGLEFQYLKEDNQPWTSAEPKNLIRSVRVSLQCRAAQRDANFITANIDKFQTISLTAEVRPRNIAVSENPEDKTPPAVPLSQPGSIFKAWDEGQCGCLQLKWTPNADSDIAGYTVYYGFAAGSYIGRARVVHQDAAYQYFTLRNLAAANVPYYIALAAYDKSGNQSALCTPISANPNPSVRTEAGSGSDTTITPLPPAAPGAPSVATPADNQLQVSWTKTYSDCMTAPVFGYRVYRSANPTFTPQGTAAGLGNCIADERTLGPDATSYLDTGADTPAGYLVGCVPYYYKIATVNCDPAQLSNYTDPGAGTTTTYTAAQFASISGSPTDGTRTSSPVLNSKAGYRRIILSVTNPSRAAGQFPDFTFTRIYFSTAGSPQLSETRDAEGYNVVTDPGGGPARLIPDGGGIVAGGGGPYTINFDDEDSEIPNGSPAGIGNPQLNKDATYYFLAVAYDRCKNHSEDTAEARSTAEQCSDCLVGEVCRDAPPPAMDLRVTQGCNGAPLRLEWNYDAGNYITNPDFQGFRVVRCQGAGCVPLDPALGGGGTVLGGTYLSPDTYLLDDSVVDGQIYNYRVYAGDCYYQRWLEGQAIDPANDPTNNAASTSISGIALGFFDRAHVVGDLETTLTADIDSVQNTIPVASTVGWTHRQIQINSEVIECNGVTPTEFTDCWWRGAEGTVAISHTAGTPVRSYPPAPARAAVTGDLSLVPPTFLHNFVLVGARNTSAGQLRLTELESSWEDPAAFFTRLLYYDQAGTATVLMEDTVPFQHGSSGSIAVLQPVDVDPQLDNIPLKLTFLKADGTADSSLDLREEPIDLRWHYRNNATGIDTCMRAWAPPAPEGIIAPQGPTIMGTTQSAPTWGTVAWPVPGLQNNPPDAVVVPSGSWNFVQTNVHDTSGTGIASVRLYYTTTDPGVDVAPAVSGAYPGCDPYTMVELTNWAGTEIWSGSFPAWPIQPSSLDGRNVWFFVVAVDNEGNFDREPEVNQGAFQYFQQPEDPCLNTPRAPELTGTSDASSVRLDWSGSWWGPPPTYYNTNWSVCTDLAGFRVYHQIGQRSWNEVAGSPFPATTQNYTKTFTIAVATLAGAVGLADSTLPVNSTAGFLPSGGKVRIDTEIINCTGVTVDSFTGCTRAVDGTTAATHAPGAGVTQDLIALYANSFFVRAFDTCGTGVKFSDSAIFTEGFCSPRCQMQVWPSGTSIQPGDTVWVQIQACEKAGNGSADTIYVHTCSSVEGDDFALTESGDSGWFSGSFSTQLANSAGGGNAVLMVRADDTITIGGFESGPSGFGNLDVCTGHTYSCGAAQTVTVHTLGADVCADDHTPPVPSGVSTTKVGSCSTESVLPNNTKQLTVSWSKVSPPPGCTRMYYRGYQCETAGCTPSTPINGFFASEAGNCPGGTTCTSNQIAEASKLDSKVYRFAVSAVCEIDNCSTAPTIRTWESAVSGVADDPCP